MKRESLNNKIQAKKCFGHEIIFCHPSSYLHRYPDGCWINHTIYSHKSNQRKSKYTFWTDSCRVHIHKWSREGQPHSLFSKGNFLLICHMIKTSKETSLSKHRKHFAVSIWIWAALPIIACVQQHNTGLHLWNVFAPLIASCKRGGGVPPCTSHMT